MSTYFFKTNINCLGCVTQIKPHLDKMESDKTIERWHIDFNHPEHILEIETNQLDQEQVKHLIRETGFEAEFTKAPQAS
ncbi:MAG: heavy-metal-associated domain-containing protein [Chitinophagaceae bacterium]|nr:heavy-metal-associated domain-containing protein [Chitinophagaceae bacterium]